MNLKKIEKPFNFILFGASGDLAFLKIFPSLYAMALQKRFQKDFRIIGFGRSEMSDKEFRALAKKSMKKFTDKKIYDDAVADKLTDNFYYQKGDYGNIKSYEALAEKMLKDGAYNLAFLAVPPSIYGSITSNLAQIAKSAGGLKIMIEKPFGSDRRTAEELFSLLTSNFSINDIFLIDHYLGKAPVQSILPLRYNNTILNLLLKGKAIANIQISALEKVGVDERIGYFDKVGIIKDMVQSHLLQILTLITMSMPTELNEKSIRREKNNILSSLMLADSGCNSVIGKYASYDKQEGVDKNYQTPTFAAFRLFIDMAEWYKVPIFIRTGKKLSSKHTYIVVEFKKPPFAGNDIDANRLIIELYPSEQIQIRLVNDIGKEQNKSSGLISQDSLACMGDDCLPEYGRLILNAFLGDHSSFLSIDEIYSSWDFVDSLMECIKKRKVTLDTYKDGSRGPEKQNELLAQDGFEWYEPEKL